MRRYETRSTIMTSNRPLEDWGKLIGDVPSATAILDRFLHHAEILTMNGRSYRLRNRTNGENTDTPPEPQSDSKPRAPSHFRPPAPSTLPRKADPEKASRQRRQPLRIVTLLRIMNPQKPRLPQFRPEVAGFNSPDDTPPSESKSVTEKRGGWGFWGRELGPLVPPPVAGRGQVAGHPHVCGPPSAGAVAFAIGFPPAFQLDAFLERHRRRAIASARLVSAGEFILFRHARIVGWLASCRRRMRAVMGSSAAACLRWTRCGAASMVLAALSALMRRGQFRHGWPFLVC